MTGKNVSFGSPYEGPVGFSRATRAGRVIAVWAVAFAAAASAAAKANDDNGILPPGAEVVGQEYIKTLSDGMDGPTLLFDGKCEIECRVFGAELLNAPFTGKECVHWWVESYYEEDDTRYHIITRAADSDIYAKVGDVYVEVKFLEHGFKPDYKKTYENGYEPAHFGAAGPGNPVAGPGNPVAGPGNPVAGPEFLGYPEATYYEWVLKPGKEYKVTVEVYGGVYEVPEGVEYVTNYIFTFK